MASSILEKAIDPEAALPDVLGAAMPAWNAILASLRARADLCVEWKHYGAKHGWQLKASRKKRAVIYLVPHEGSFTAGLALSDAALAALAGSGLPPALVREIESAKKAPEGRPARVEVKGAGELAIVERLLAIKLGA